MARSRPELSAGFLLLAKSYRFPVEERIEGLGRVVNNCEEGVSFSRTDDVQFHRGFRRGRHGFASSSTHGAIGELQTLFASEQVPGLWSGMLVRHDIGFRAKISFSDDDLIADSRRNRGQWVGFRDKRSSFGITTFDARVRSQTLPAASTTTLAGVTASLAASVLNYTTSHADRVGPSVRLYRSRRSRG